MGVLRRSKLNESKVKSKILLTCTENEVNSFGRFKIIKGKDKDSPALPSPTSSKSPLNPEWFLTAYTSLLRKWQKLAPG